MKRKTCFAIVCCMMVLTGCSGVRGYLNDQMAKQAGVADRPEYKKYQRYNKEGKLDNDGYFTEEAFEEKTSMQESIQPNTARISFPENQYLNVKYYLDENLTQEVGPDDNIFSVGSCIYASVSIDASAPSSEYHCSEFRLSEIGKNGESVQLSSLELKDNGLLFELTTEYDGKDLMIAPLGAYSMRDVSLRSTFIDQDEAEHDLAGTWYINDKKMDSSPAKINPRSSYIVSYDFDGEQYFYLSSEPECYYCNNEDGIVIFEKREATDETLDYEIKLHEYVTVNITSNELRYVSINNQGMHQIAAGADLVIPKLKYGDTVVIVTNNKWSDLENCKDLVCVSYETPYMNGQPQHRYTMTVPEKGAEFHFDPSDYHFEHGDISFFCMGEEVSSSMELATGRKIVYEQKRADNGYAIPDGEHVITVSTPEQTKKDIESIHFVEKVGVQVALPQPKYGGSIEYYVDGTKLTSSQFSGESGTVIMMKFKPWEGWINKYHDGEKYSVTNELTQTIVFPQNQSVDAIFEEDPNHKPELTVVLKKSLGENARFSFEASGLDEKFYNYEPKLFRDDYTIISNHKIGTEKGVSFSIGNTSIQAGTAIKIQIDKVGEDKTKTEKVTESHYRLVDSLTGVQEPINIYDSPLVGDSKVWYSSVKITISLVDVKVFNQPMPLDNSQIEVRKSASGDLLKDKDILEGGEKVTLTIKPLPGYYITGKSVNDNCYKSTMEFKKLLSSIQTIINSHPISKNIQVTLDASDAYGTCSYFVNDKKVNGAVYLKKGDKL